MTESPRLRALIDTNVVLDVLLERLPFFDEADAVWKKCDEGVIDGFVSAVTITTIFYVARKLLGAQQALEAVATCMEAFQIAPIDRHALELALQLTGDDFEDNVQIACARTAQLDHVITRDRTGFAASDVAVLTPREVLQRLGGG
jgi:predicted nucleic acid-binding protein